MWPFFQQKKKQTIIHTLYLKEQKKKIGCLRHEHSTLHLEKPFIRFLCLFLEICINFKLEIILLA